MKTSIHLAASLILAALLYPLFSWKALLVLTGGVLIDVDHYLWYVYKYKKFNLLDSYKFYLKNMETNNFTNVMGILLVFHTIEFLLLLAFLSFYYESVLAFTIGLLSHYFLDVIFLYSVPKRIITNHSIISWIVKNRIKH